MAVFRLVGALLLLIPFVPAYLAGAAYQCVVSAWRGGRADARRQVEGE